MQKKFDRFDIRYTFAVLKVEQAGIAQLVEHNLAKVRVASSSLVSRSMVPVCRDRDFFYPFALVVESVDTQDLKSCDPKRSCGFKSRPGYTPALSNTI